MQKHFTLLWKACIKTLNASIELTDAQRIRLIIEFDRKKLRIQLDHWHEFRRAKKYKRTKLSNGISEWEISEAFDLLTS